MADIVYDSFAGTAGTLVTSHTSNSGQTWSMRDGSSAGSGRPAGYPYLQLTGSGGLQYVYGGSLSTELPIALNASLSAINEYTQATFVYNTPPLGAPPTGTALLTVYGWMAKADAASAATGYCFAMLSTAGAPSGGSVPVNIRINNNLSGTFTFNTSVNFNITAGTQYLLRLELNGTTLTGRLLNAAGTVDQVTPVVLTDGTLAAVAGTVGLDFGSAGANLSGFPPSTSVWPIVVSHFGAGALGPPPPNPNFWTRFVNDYEVP